MMASSFAYSGTLLIASAFLLSGPAAASAGPTVVETPVCAELHCMQVENKTGGDELPFNGPINSASFKPAANGTLLANISGVLQCTIGPTTDVTSVLLVIGTVKKPPTSSLKMAPGILPLFLRNGTNDRSDAVGIPFSISKSMRVLKKKKVNIYANYFIDMGGFSACRIDGGSFVLQFFPES